jgi:hypothetical protein
MEDNDRFVEKLLDSALAQRRDAEPRAGLDGRILAHIRATASERSAARKAWKWWAAAATTAAVLVLVAIYSSNRALRTVPQTSQAANTAPVAPPTETLNVKSETAAAGVTKAVEPIQIARRVKKPLRHVEAHHWPSQFPTPAPLTAEQRALVQYVQQTPPQVLSAPVVKADFTVPRVEIRPLDIPSLEIRPLALSPTGQEVQ